MVQKKIADYDRTDLDSILRFASRLSGHCLAEFGELDLGGADARNRKGYFGQNLETLYFGLPNNNSPLPDFRDVHLELKSTPMKKTGSGIVSKERLVLNIIDFMKVRKNSWEQMFMNKDSDLLIVFYQYVPDVPFQDLKVLKVVYWTFPAEDLKIIHDDWNTIEKFILDGRAEELSERLTNYLGACPKGAGHDQDLREQPFSPHKARQRALALKSAYVNKIYQGSADLADQYSGRARIAASKNENIRFNGPLSDYLTFDDAVTKKLSAFTGLTCGEIEQQTETVNPVAKSYYATLSLRMLGVRTKHAKQFEDGDITMKIIRLGRNGRSRESMSFPAFDYNKIIKQSWEESDFEADLDKRFFFVVYQMTDADNKDKRKAKFLGAFFWSMPYEDLLEVQKVWEKTKQAIVHSNYDDLPRKTGSRVAHVRPHGRDSSDRIRGPDGNLHVKKCFWLNDDYITAIAKRYLDMTDSTL